MSHQCLMYEDFEPQIKLRFLSGQETFSRCRRLQLRNGTPPTWPYGKADIIHATNRARRAPRRALSAYEQGYRATDDWATRAGWSDTKTHSSPTSRVERARLVPSGTRWSCSFSRRGISSDFGCRRDRQCRGTAKVRWRPNEEQPGRVLPSG